MKRCSCALIGCNGVCAGAEHLQAEGRDRACPAPLLASDTGRRKAADKYLMSCQRTRMHTETHLLAIYHPRCLSAPDVERYGGLSRHAACSCPPQPTAIDSELRRTRGHRWGIARAHLLWATYRSARAHDNPQAYPHHATYPGPGEPPYASRATALTRAACRCLTRTQLEMHDPSAYLSHPLFTPPAPREQPPTKYKCA